MYVKSNEQSIVTYSVKKFFFIVFKTSSHPVISKMFPNAARDHHLAVIIHINTLSILFVL